MSPKYIILILYIMPGYKKLLFTSLLALTLLPSFGQNTDSPYSRYGYGILNNQAIGASRSMGGISYGVRGANTNPGNPASYTRVDSLTFIFDIGINYNKSRLSEGSNTQTHDNGGLDYVAMQFPVSRNMGVSIGLLPFSSVGYSFGAVENEGVTTTKTFSGSGGFSEVYGGFAYEPVKNISIGANVGFLFGNTTFDRTLVITGVPSANSQYWYHKLTINALRLKFGAQYTLPLNKKDNIIVGAVFSPAIKKTAKIDRVNNKYDSAGNLIPGDTVAYRGEDAHADIPNTFGAGFTWNRNNKLTVGADVTYQTWSKARYSENLGDELNNYNRFNDRWIFNAGFEYAIDPYDRSFFKRMKFRGGLNYSDSYINVLDNNGVTSGYKEYGATVGFGLPLRDNFSGRVSYINIGFEYKNVSPSNNSLIKEQYFGVSVGVTLNELWFFKNKFR